MVTPESLPERPLRKAEMDAIENHERVERALPCAEAGGPGGGEVLQFLVQFEAETVGLEFVPAATEWREVTRAPTWEEASVELAEKRTTGDSTA